jgi:hypothetical protein
MNVALVLGGAECVDADVESLEHLLGEPWPGTTIACNDMIWRWPRTLHHAVTLHAEKLPDWIKRRQQRGYSNDFVTWTARGHEARGEPTDRVLSDIMRSGISEGSSGLLAVQVALELGLRAVLCGIPMDRRPHFQGSTAEGPFQTEYPESDRQKLQGFRGVWESEMSRLQGCVRSMSGWTCDVLGSPDLEFIYGE